MWTLMLVTVLGHKIDLDYMPTHTQCKQVAQEIAYLAVNDSPGMLLCVPQATEVDDDDDEERHPA